MQYTTTEKIILPCKAMNNVTFLHQDNYFFNVKKNQINRIKLCTNITTFQFDRTLQLFWSVDNRTSVLTSLHIMVFSGLRFVSLKFPHKFKRFTPQHLKVTKLFCCLLHMSIMILMITLFNLQVAVEVLMLTAFE